jgi:hypothetical protein
MNERIRELCKRAGFIGEGFQNTVIGTCQETALENLAELIVAECIDIVAAGGEFVSRPKLVEQIQTHFGVE